MISVIVAAYNIVEYLEQCIKSIVGQTYKDLEIIIVDDGSTDGTEKLCDELKQTDDRILVIHKTNGGLSDARNAGLDIATGKYISFIDGDDVIDEKMYECMLHAFSEHSDVSFVACGMIDYDCDNNFRRVVTSNNLQILNREQAYRCFFKTGEDIVGNSSCNKLYRYELFENLRFKKGIVSEDIELIYRLIDKCVYIVCIPEAFYRYMYREGSITTEGKMLKRMDLLDILFEIGDFIQMKHPQLVVDFRLYELMWLVNIWDLIEEYENTKEVMDKKMIIRERVKLNLKSYDNIGIVFRKGFRKIFLKANAIRMNCYGIVKRI